MKWDELFVVMGEKKLGKLLNVIKLFNHAK